MKILAIGNSFSMDAMQYLHQIAAAGGEDITCKNLYIGGCSLERHVRNIASEEAAYELQINGERTETFVSVKEALLSEKWDVVTMQQASHLAFEYSSYVPYLKIVSDFVTRLVPDAAQALHCTWAYEDGGEMQKKKGITCADDQFYMTKCAYLAATKLVGNLPIIPTGDAFQYAKKLGIKKLHRDGHHASYGIGCYILGAVWYEFFTGKSILENPFCELSEEFDPAELEKAKVAAHSAVAFPIKIFSE